MIIPFDINRNGELDGFEIAMMLEEMEREEDEEDSES